MSSLHSLTVLTTETSVCVCVQGGGGGGGGECMGHTVSISKSLLLAGDIA